MNEAEAEALIGRARAAMAPPAQSWPCGQELRVTDVFNATAVRFVSQCGGRFLVITNGLALGTLNGLLVADWRGVLRELVAMAVPRKMIEKRMRAESMAGGLYHSVELTYPISATELACLLDAPAAEVQALLSDYAVPIEVPL